MEVGRGLGTELFSMVGLGGDCLGSELGCTDIGKLWWWVSRREEEEEGRNGVHVL